MSRVRYSFLLFLFPFVLSCQKVIEIKVKESDTRYVIEGLVTNESTPGKVKISRTNPLNSDNNFLNISGASVKIRDNGIEHTLAEVSPGIYQTSGLTGIPGHRYELSVMINGESFSATSTMPQPVLLDTMYVDYGPFGQFRFASIGFTDPAGIDNGYRFIQYVNGVKDPRIFWHDDELTDGDRTLIMLDTGIDKKDDPRNIDSGDEVIIEMQVLDQAMLNYWYTLRTGGGVGSGNIASPSNPVTNISGDALGYFSAYTVTRKKVIVP